MAGYGTDTDFDDWLEEHGHELPADAPSHAVLRQRGSVYVDGRFGAQFSGAPAGGYAQERAWPRADASTRYGAAIPEDVIPPAIMQATYAAAYYEAENPGGLNVAVVASAQIKREKTDVLETEYFAGSGDALADATPALSAVEGLLAPYLMDVLPAVLVV